jgi:hypothetical protein
MRPKEGGGEKALFSSPKPARESTAGPTYSGRVTWITARGAVSGVSAGAAPAPKKPWTTPTVTEIPCNTLPTELRMMALG